MTYKAEINVHVSYQSHCSIVSRCGTMIEKQKPQQVQALLIWNLCNIINLKIYTPRNYPNPQGRHLA